MKKLFDAIRKNPCLLLPEDANDTPTKAKVRMIKVKWLIRHLISKGVMHVHKSELILYVMLFFC